MKSNNNELIWQDLKKWFNNLLIFSAGALIVFLTALQNGVDFKTALLAMYPALINALIDLIKKYKVETKY